MFYDNKPGTQLTAIIFTAIATIFTATWILVCFENQFEAKILIFLSSFFSKFHLLPYLEVSLFEWWELIQFELCPIWDQSQDLWECNCL